MSAFLLNVNYMNTTDLKKKKKVVSENTGQNELRSHIWLNKEQRLIDGVNY